MLIKTCEEVNDYVRPLLEQGILFECHEVKVLKTKSNKRSKFYRLEFTWTKDGKHFSFGRRSKAIDIMNVVDGYVEEVNRISST